MLDAIDSLTKRIESVERENRILTNRMSYLEGIHVYPNYYGYPVPAPPIRSPYIVSPPKALTTTPSSQQSSAESDPDLYLINKENTPPQNKEILEQNEVSDKPPMPVPAVAPMSSKKETPLPPINYDELLRPEDVVMKYPKLASVSKIPTLAVRLAKEAFFGRYVMSFCTFRGLGSFHALPEKEVANMKAFLLKLCVPQYVSSRVEFECLYKKCIESVGQSCKALRRLRLSNQKLI